MLSLYDEKCESDFNPLNLKNIFAKYDVDGVSNESYCILSGNKKNSFKLISRKEEIFEVQSEQVSIKGDLVLTRSDIYSGKFDKADAVVVNKTNDVYLDICNEILSFEFSQYIKFYNVIKSYLTNRKSEGKPLTSHDSIKISLSECVESIFLIQRSLAKTDSINELSFVSNTLLGGIKTLAMCAGGRSFTGKNILEFFWVYTLTNNFLLKEVEA